MNEVEKIKAGLPTTDVDIEALMREDAGRGISQRAADNLVPRIILLQSGSPLVKAGGAAAGDFQIGDEIVPGSRGFCFQPCFQGQLWIEFKPLDDGGGFVATHPFVDERTLPAGAKRRDQFDFYFPARGTELIHYRQFAGIFWRDKIGLEYVIPFKSTGHTIARDWNTRSGQINRLSDGRARSLFAHVWHVGSIEVKRKQYAWHNLKIDRPILLDRPAADAANAIVGDWAQAYLRGRALNAAFASGEKEGELEVARGDEPSPESDDEAASF